MSTSKQATPLSPLEAEALAVGLVQSYLTGCRMTDRTQIGNYLMKLCSVAGVVMAQAEGAERAAERLDGTAAFIRKKMPAAPARLETLQ